mgnify:FL=1
MCDQSAYFEFKYLFNYFFVFLRISEILHNASCSNSIKRLKLSFSWKGEENEYRWDRKEGKSISINLKYSLIINRKSKIKNSNDRTKEKYQGLQRINNKQ